MKSRENVTTEKDAPVVAQKVMEQFGGLPEDAVSAGAITAYSKYYENGKLVKKEPESTTISYNQKINGLPVFGQSNFIILTLGTDGEVVWIRKEWRNFTNIGEVSLISMDKAIEKLERQELIESSWHPSQGNITIDSIGLGYYAKERRDSETITEPVWWMSGTGYPTWHFSYYMYARQFANFTVKPSPARVADDMKFSDISYSQAYRWYWDFGDGTISTHPITEHIYRIPGTYNVTLTVWDDMGSDTVTKPVLVLP